MKRRHLALCLLTAVTLLPGAARAQDGLPAMNMIGEKPVDPEFEERKARIDAEYQARRRASTGPEQKVDPWGTIRPAEPAKPAAPAKKQAGAKEPK